MANASQDALNGVTSLYGGAGGGGGYSGEIKSDIKSGGTNKGAFGAVNFGAGASGIGGGTLSDSQDGGGSKVLLYVGIGVVALVAMFLILRR